MMIGAPPRSPYADALGNSGPLLNLPPIAMPPPQAPKSGKPSLLGILADALSGAAGMPGAYAARRAAEKQQQDELDRQMQIYRMKQNEPIRTEVGGDYVQIDPATGQSKVLYHGQNTSPMVRDLQAWLGMTPDQRQAYQGMKQATAGDPDTVVTLPNGQLYAGPRSGLAAALGGVAASPPATVPAKPVGGLTPITDGGPTLPASGGFRSVTRAQEGVESGHRPGIAGPMTPYGQAYGLRQVQDATGAEMARKLGVPWRPDLMRAQNEMGAAYQRMIGDAYLKEGIAKTGSLRGGLMYYHGGPNRRLWGPKTQQYADTILSRSGS